MYQQIQNSKKRSFCQLLNISNTSEETLEKFSSEWVQFLRAYYNGTTTLTAEYLPFYHVDFHELCTKIANKENYKATRLFCKPNFERVDNIQYPHLLLPIPPINIFKYSIRGSGLDEFKKEKKELDLLPNGVVYGVFNPNDTRKIQIFAHLTPNEIKNKLSLSKVSIQLEDLRLFCSRTKHLSVVPGYIVPSKEMLYNKFNEGLIVGTFETFYDIKYWSKI